MRRAPRPVWLPALLLWGPLMVLGTWMMAGIRLGFNRVGEREWTMSFVFPSPANWFATPAAYVGASILLVGVVLWILALMQPDPDRWFFVAARYPEFAVAGHLLLLTAFLSTIEFSGPVVGAGAGGLAWRAITTLRSTPNLIAAGVLGVLALVAYGLSFGTRRRLWT